jgi:hypothetical protein
VVSLALSHFALSVVPASFGGLAALVSLSLDGNKLREEIPEAAFTGSSQPLLSYVVLSGCNLTSLPSSLAGLSALAALWVDDNAIAELPASFFAPGALPSLRALYFQLNAIKSIPPPPPAGALYALSSLKWLNLDWNRLDCAALPASLPYFVRSSCDQTRQIPNILSPSSSSSPPPSSPLSPSSSGRHHRPGLGRGIIAAIVAGSAIILTALAIAVVEIVMRKRSKTWPPVDTLQSPPPPPPSTRPVIDEESPLVQEAH